MKFYDFEYDGLLLSDMGFTVCGFGSNSNDVAVGSQLEFETVPFLQGTKHILTNVLYKECLSLTFQICRNHCFDSNMEISIEDVRKLYRWLNRKSFYKFKIKAAGYENLYFEGSFNISTIERRGKIYGFELTLTTNRPFALYEPIHININNMVENGTYVIHDISDEEGELFPVLEIEVLSETNNDLIIQNSLSDDDFVIKNCRPGEIITIDYPKIFSTDNSHILQNDFNWSFLKIINNFSNKQNVLTISIPCNIKLIYSPIAKVTF